MMKTFTIVENPNYDHYSIRIDEGEFAGIVYSYNTVSCWENTGETATVKFDFNIHSKPNGLKLNERFEKTI